MKVYIILGTTGTGIYQIKDELTGIVGKPVGLRTTDKPNFSSTCFEFEVVSPREAKQLIDKAFDWLIKQPFYFDDKTMSFSISGLVDDKGDDWYCDDCGNDIDNCECILQEVK